MTKYSDHNYPLLPERHYHIYNHANGDHNIFFNNENRRYFLQKYDEYMYAYVHTFAYCLMPNHFHIQIQVRSNAEILLAAKEDFPKGLSKITRKAVDSFENKEELTDDEVTSVVSERLRRFFLSYSKSINSQEKCSGSLFRKNYRRKPIDTINYFLGCIAYIHRNPTHHGFTDDWENWEWSSYGRILLPAVTHLQKDIVLQNFGSKNEYLAYHQAYDEYKKDAEHWAIED